jgi:hypothetical protein
MRSPTGSPRRSPAKSPQSSQPALAISSRKQKQRKKFRKSERGREARRQRRAGISKDRLEERLRKETTKVATSLNIVNLPKNTAGFCGSLAVAHSNTVDRLKTDEQYFNETLRRMQPIAFELVSPHVSSIERWIDVQVALM